MPAYVVASLTVSDCFLFSTSNNACSS